MTIGFIGFGANLSNPKASFLAAIDRLVDQDIHILARSSLWSSPAWPAGSGQPDYINAVVQIETDLEAVALLKLLNRIESELGRVRTVKNAARTLDLDILIFGEERRDTDFLTLPHPRMLDRAFVLLPLCEIAPDWISALARLSSADVDAMGYVGRW